jgi:hypothetical protein
MKLIIPSPLLVGGCRHTDNMTDNEQGRILSSFQTLNINNVQNIKWFLKYFQDVYFYNAMVQEKIPLVENWGSNIWVTKTEKGHKRITN